jgi:hypothetical protein
MIAKQEQNVARLEQYLKAMDMTIYRVSNIKLILIE